MARVITEPLGGSALSRAASAGLTPADWYERSPANTDEWATRIRSVRDDFAGSGWADALAPALTPSGAAAQRLASVAAGKGVVVTTGQQPGLFGGPIYTWSKAFSALALANELQAATGVPVAPVFWAATDDSDFAEASWTMVAKAGGARELRMHGDDSGLSMANTPLGDQLHLIAQLERASGSAAYQEALAMLRRAYDPSHTIGGAYVALLRAVLEPLGISVLDAAHPVVRKAGAPLLRRALGSAVAIANAVAERDRALAAAGHAPQVASVAGLSLVFASERGQRQRIAIAEGESVAASRSDDALSPNVLLRPVMERQILPTVAYLAGPAELAYFAQTGAVAAALGVARPLALPRWSCTILEPHVEQILQRLELVPDDLIDPHAAEIRLARAALPSEVSSALARMRNALDENFGVIAQHAGESVPQKVIDGSRASVAHRVARLERRLVAAVKRANSALLQDVGTVRGSLYPAGKRQERALNFIPLLARYGRLLPDLMIESASVHARALVHPPATQREDSPASAAARRA